MTNSLHPNEGPVERRSLRSGRWRGCRPRARPRAGRPTDSEPAGAAATTAPADATATQPGKPRDAFFDNAKYLAIVLVAMGHAWEPLKGQSRVLEAAYMTVVYAFHMPAFIIISGYFSRSFDMRADRLKRLVTGVAVPYVVFEVAYVLFKRWADDDPSLPVSLLDPWFLTWFLCALFIWRLTTPLWKLVQPAASARSPRGHARDHLAVHR